MEQLNKQQVILLALLVSFVSSIATGIVTVSLMEQDQPTATQTVNRIVERTIEKASESSSGATKETIIVRDDESVASTVATVSRSLIRMYTSDSVSPSSFVGIGLVVSSSGLVVTPSVIPSGVSIVGRFQTGNEISLVPLTRDADKGVSLLQADQGSGLADTRVYTPATLADSNKVKLGQSIVAIGGISDPAVATGIVSSMLDRGGLKLLRAGLNDEGFDSSAILANLLGEVVGIQNGHASEKTFIPSNIIKTYATP